MQTNVSRLWALTLLVVVIGCAFFTTLAECERLYWQAYLVAQFRVELFAISFLAAIVIFASSRSKPLLTISLICALVNLSHLTAYYTPYQTGQSKTKLRLLQMNLNVKNHEFEKVTSYIREVNADSVLIEELTPEWREYFAKHLSRQYPHSVTVEQIDTYGIGVYNKIPFVDKHVEYFGKAKHPSIVATLSGLEKPVTLLHTHVQGPAKKPFFAWHKEQMELMVPAINELPRPIVLSGDMNANAWTYLLNDLVKKTDLVDTQNGRGIRLSWPAPFYWRNWPFQLLSIDHYFVSKDISVSKRALGKPIFSDHYPVILEFGIRQ